MAESNEKIEDKTKEEGVFNFESEENEEDITNSNNSEKMSPRDKKTKLNEDEQTSADYKQTSKPLFVPASPPKFVSFDQIMQAANGVANMALAHEIAVDNEFRFNKQELSEKSIEKQVADVMKKAFWDALQEKLQQDPPDFSHGLVLLQEVKEMLEALLLPQHKRIKAQVNEILDMELIKQKTENEALDFQYYADYVISIMAQLCAPARDEKIAQLRTIKEVVPLFQGIFDLLELMNMDIANFTIQQVRPYIQQQSVEYEKKKFKEFLAQSTENNVDGLQFTKAWLERSAEKFYIANSESQASESLPGPSTSASATQQMSALTPLNIMNNSYMELLSWPLNQGYPETVVLDQKRFLDLEKKLKYSTLISTIIVVTYNIVGGSIAGMTEFKNTLKEKLCIILKDVLERDLEESLKNIAVQVEKDVNECLQSHGFPVLDKTRREMLQGQIVQICSKDNSVHNLMGARINAFVKSLLTGRNSSQLQIPPGFSAVSEELKHICGQFLRLVSHNRQVYGQYYAEIIGEIMQRYNNSNTS